MMTGFINEPTLNLLDDFTTSMNSYSDFSSSPSDNNSSNGGENSLDYDSFNLEDDDQDQILPEGDESTVKRRNRRPPSTAAKRATHNAIERARRETLNGKFLELAHALPNMTSVKRPSKSSIVIKSLEFVYSVKSREQNLNNQNDQLRKEVEELRSKLGLPKSSQSPNFDSIKLVTKPSVSKKSQESMKKKNVPTLVKSTPFDYGFPPVPIAINEKISQPSLSPELLETSSFSSSESTNYLSALFAAPNTNELGPNGLNFYVPQTNYLPNPSSFNTNLGFDWSNLVQTNFGEIYV